MQREALGALLEGPSKDGHSSPLLPGTPCSPVAQPNLRCHLRDHPNVLWPGLSPQSEVWARCCPKAVGIGEPSETHSDVSGDSDVPLDANFSECVQQPGFLTQSGHGLPEFSVAGTERAEHSQP